MDLDRAIGELREAVVHGGMDDGATVVVNAELDREGTGVIFVRSATADLGALETQLRKLAGWCAEHDNAPRLVVAAAGTGGAPYEERPDLHAIVGESERGSSWVVALNACCVARRTDTLLTFIGELYDRGAHLFLHNLGGAPLVGVYLQKFLAYRREDERARFIARMRESALRPTATGAAVGG